MPKALAYSLATVCGWLILAVTPAAAQTTVYLRQGWPPGAKLTNCTNATPIVCTTDVPHQLSAGDTVDIFNVIGNTNANGLRKVAASPAPTANTIALQDLAGIPVSGNGNWLTGGNEFAGASLKWVGKVRPFTLKGHPRVVLDGPDGRLTRALRCSVGGGCLTGIVVNNNVATATIPGGYGLTAGKRIGVWNSSTSALNGTYVLTGATSTTYTFTTSGVANGTYNTPGLTISSYAWTGNLAWEALRNMVSGWAPYYNDYNWNSNMQKALAAAVMWYTDRTSSLAPTALAMARRAILEPMDALYGNSACDESQNYCNGRAASVDYARAHVARQAAIYSILVAENQLTPSEKTNFLNQMFADKNEGCTLPPVVTGTGTIAVNGYEVVGTGTNFLTTFAPGDTIWIPIYGDDEYNAARVVSVASDTSLITTRYKIYTGAYSYTKAWVPGQCGMIQHIKHHPSAVLGDPSLYPQRGGGVNDGGGTSFYHNLPLTAVWSYVLTAIGLADDDARARRLLEDIWNFGYDHVIGYAMNSWSGFTQAGGTYHWYRSPWMAAEIAYALKYSVNDYPDLTGDHWLKDTLMLDVYSNLPSSNVELERNFFILFGEYSLNVSYYNTATHSLIQKLFDGTPENAYYQWWLKNRHGYTLSGIGWGASDAVIYWYLGVNPNHAETTINNLPLQRIFDRTDYANCWQLGMRYCNDKNSNYGVAISRTGWTNPEDTMVQLYGGTYQEDHFANAAGDYRISKGEAGYQPCLIGGDSSVCTSITYDQNNITDVGPYYGRLFGGLSFPQPTSRFARMSGDPVTGDAESRYLSTMVDYTASYRPIFEVTRAQRHFVHFKKAGTKESLIVYDDMGVALPAQIRAYTHYAQNGQSGEGATACIGGCSTANIASGRIISASPTNTLVTQYHAVHPSTRFRLFVNNSNGSYLGGNGHTFRLTYCATKDDATCTSESTGMEALIVHRIKAGIGDNSLDSVVLSPSSAWTGVQADGNVALFARHMHLPDHVPAFETTHTGTGQYVVNGLKPGVYNVLKNGSPVVTGVSVVEGDHSLYFEGTAGTYEVRLTTPALSGAAAETSNTAGLINYLPSGEASCSWQLASDEAQANVLQSGTDEAGSVWRQAPLTGLTPGSVGYFRALCGSASRQVSVTAASQTQTGSRTITFSVRPLAALGADNVLLEWGSTAATLTNSASFTCTNGCSPSITAAANSILFVRLRYRTGTTAKALTEVRRVLVR